MAATRVGVCLAVAVALLPAPARAAREGRPAVLPLRDVVLYESGVGYFERRGSVDRTADLALLVPENHLDDALATLVVLTPDGARVGAFSFASVLARDMALAESPVDFASFEQGGSLLPLLEALRGLEALLVTVAGESVAGRVVGAARIPEVAPPGVDSA